jgi:hypothetical protein
MIRISVCMIVKNEEAVLDRCLGSLSGIADEIVLADTGSADRTKEIAANYTDKIYNFPWTGDFSAARNFVFSKASMDYIYSADADEVLDEENRRKFLRLKRTLPPDAEIVQMKYANQTRYNTAYNFDTELRPKLFRRLRTFRWVDPVHETVDLGVRIVNSGITVRHMPAGLHSGRDFSLLEAAAKAGPLSERLARMYAKELFISGTDRDVLAALPCFEPVLHDENRGLDEVRVAQCVAVRGARLKGDAAAMFKTALKNVIADPCAEVCCELGAYFEASGDWEEAATWYYTAAFGAQSELNVHSSGDIPLRGLAACYEKLGAPAEAEKYRSRADEWVPPQSGDT